MVLEELQKSMPKKPELMHRETKTLFDFVKRAFSLIKFVSEMFDIDFETSKLASDAKRSPENY